MLKRLLHPTNRRTRWIVGIFLAGLFCIQCTRTEAFKESKYIIAISGHDLGQLAPDAALELEELAKTDQIALLERCLENYQANYSDFTCTFIKQEMIHGALKPEQEITVKHIAEPFSVAMEWLTNAPVGDRVLYVEGKNGDQMLVRPKSPLLQVLVGGHVTRPPDGAEAMKNTLRPVNLFGFGRSLQSLLDVYRAAEEAGDLKTAVGEYAEVAGQKCLVLVRYLPAKPEYPAYKTIVYIDLAHMVPICIEGYDWDEQLICRYIYKDLKFNIGLSADDFLPEANGMTAKK